MSESVGRKLRQAREARSLTLEQVAQATHMRSHYLQALEIGKFDSLPSQAQARGFLRAYADYLGLDGIELLAILDDDEKLAASPDDKLPAPPSAPPTDQARADEIFTEIGRSLQQQRNILGLSLDDVERHTHLRQHYLRALESGDMSGLPSPVQGRGMLNNYAAFLGLDPEPLLLRFADGLQAGLVARQAARPETRARTARRTSRLPTSMRRWLSADILIGGTLGLFLLIFVLWGAIRVFAIQSDQSPTNTAPSIAEVLLASPTASDTPTPAPPTPTSLQPAFLFPTQLVATDVLSGEPFPSDAQGDVQVYVTVRQRTWVRIWVDGEVAFDGRVIPGSAYAYTGVSSVEILTGNGAALYIYFNQQDLGPMGSFGQIVHRIYGPQGILAPTPTITLTPTETTPATATPMASATPQPGQVTVPALP